MPRGVDEKYTIQALGHGVAVGHEMIHLTNTAASSHSHRLVRAKTHAANTARRGVVWGIAGWWVDGVKATMVQEGHRAGELDPM